jgi:hypothetical protein
MPGAVVRLLDGAEAVYGGQASKELTRRTAGGIALHVDRVGLDDVLQ